MCINLRDMEKKCFMDKEILDKTIVFVDDVSMWLGDKGRSGMYIGD